MKATTTSCTTCGSTLDANASRYGPLCLACVLRAGYTPGSEEAGPDTTWAEVFPQLEVTRTLREQDGFAVYLARVLEGKQDEQSILQVVSGERLREAGGASALTIRAQQLTTCDIPGLAAVLDFGDLGDAYFLVTEAPVLPTLPTVLNGKDPEEMSLLLEAVSGEANRIIGAGHAQSVPLDFDPGLCFVDEECGTVLQTPLLVGEGSQQSPAAPIPALAPGSRLGSFQLTCKVGEGGFGEVWKAHQEQPVKREVAIKVLKSDLHSQRGRARFEVEQQALAKLDHPNIARFFDGGMTGEGRPYFAMEWIEGSSLTRHCTATKASLQERLDLFRQVCEAVHHAHQKGIIHRDLKPSNVMVSTANDSAAVKVIDFGIARAMEGPEIEQTQLTRAQEIVGTPASMSPEQAAGLGGGDLDARADVYGLGVLLYELLTGELPFDPQLPPDKLRLKIREVDPPKPSSRVEDASAARQLKADLDWIVMRCLEKDPARRYESVSALQRDLERFRNDEPIEAGPPVLAYRVRKFVRRHRRSLAFATILLLALVGGLVSSTTLFFREKEARQETGVALETAEDKLYAANLINARQTWEDGRIDAYWTLLNKHEPANGDKDRRGWEWYYLRSLVEWHEAEIPLHPNDSSEVLAVSADGRLLASGSGSGSIVIYDLENGRTIADLEAHEGQVTSLSWDPVEGRLASAGNDGRALLWNLQQPDQAAAILLQAPTRAMVEFSPDGTMLAIAAKADGVQHVMIRSSSSNALISSWTANTVQEFSWAPSGDRLAIAHPSAEIKATVWEASSGLLVAQITEPQIPRASSTSVAWSPDGRHLAMVGNRIWVFETETWSPVIRELSTGTFRCPGGLAWSPDSRRLAAIHQDRSIRLWDLDEKREFARFHGSRRSKWNFTSVAWLPDSSRLLTGSSDGAIRVWNTARSEPDPAIPFYHGVAALDWSADGSRLAIAARLAIVGELTVADSWVPGLSVFSPVTGELLYLECPTFIWGLDWSPTGSRCAAIGYDGNLMIWNGVTGEQITSFLAVPEAEPGNLDDGSKCRLGWSPDGSAIAAFRPGQELVVWDPSSRERRFKLEEKISMFRWSSDGRFIVTGSKNGEVILWSTEGRRLYQLPAAPDQRGAVRSLAVHPGSSRIAVAQGSKVVIWDLGPEGDNPRQVAELPRALKVEWHPDGDRLALVNWDGSIRIANASTGEELLRLPGSSQREVSLAWSPDGRRLASSSHHDASVKIWDASRGYAELPSNRWNSQQARHIDRPLADHRARLQKFEVSSANFSWNRFVMLNLLSRASSLEKTGREAESIALLQECEELLHSGEAPDEIITRDLFHHYYGMGRSEDALRIQKTRLGVLRKSLEPDDQNLLVDELNLGIVQSRAGRHTEAITTLQNLLPALERNPKVDRETWLGGEFDLATAYMHLGNFAEAASHYERMLPKLAEHIPPKEHAPWSAWLNLTRCYSQLNRHEEAVRHARKVANLRSKELGADHQSTLLAEYHLGVTLSKAGQHQEAVTVLKSVRERMTSEIKTPSEEAVLGRLEAAYRAAGNLELALQVLEERRAMVGEELNAAYREALQETGAESELLIPPGASWRWFRPEDGADPSTSDPDFFASFSKPEFDDSQWQEDQDSLLGGFGYEDYPGQYMDEVDLHRHDSEHGHHLAFFRHRFTTDDTLAHLELHLQHDDGVVIFLDGKEVARENVRNGILDADLQARECRNGAQGWQVTRITLPGPLEPGEHLLAISLHNHDCWNHDLRLAGLRLVGWNGPRRASAELARKERELAKLFTPTSVGSVLIPANSEWRWLHPVDGIDPATVSPEFHRSFFRADYDDTAWATGRDREGPDGGFGYGDERPHLVDIGTPREKALGKSAYFRHRFTTTEEHTNLELRCQRDDGIIVYLDGLEVARDNMTEGEEAYALPARTTVSQKSETSRQRVPLKGITLPPGEHILAISLHNHSALSSDLRIAAITLVEMKESEEE